MPVFSNTCINDYLRDIASLCNITKPLTCHMARHNNFAYQLKESDLQECSSFR